MEWQPIETAPIDRSEILVCRKGYGWTFLAIWDDTQGAWMVPDSYPGEWTRLLVIPTHWMKMPEPLL